MRVSNREFGFADAGHTIDGSDHAGLAINEHAAEFGKFLDPALKCGLSSGIALRGARSRTSYNFSRRSRPEQSCFIRRLTSSRNNAA